MDTAIKHPVPDRVTPSFVIFDIRAERQSARMSKITNDGLIRSGTGYFMYQYGNSGRQRVKCNEKPDMTFTRITRSASRDC